jgi:superfamily I DNA/RNA helicase
MANELIKHSSHQPVRQLDPFSTNPNGEIHVVQWNEMANEAHGIATFVKSRIDSGKVAAGRVLVLTPRRQFGYAIRDALKAVTVDAHSFFNEEELEGDPKDSSDCLAQERFTLLSLVANGEDRVSLRCWCGFGHPELQQKPWKRVAEHCAKIGISPMAVLADLSAGKLKFPHSKRLIERFDSLQAQLTVLRPLRGQALVDALFPAAEPWTEPFRSIVASASIPAPDFDSGWLLSIMRSAIAQPELPTKVDYVRIMSLHKSKGLTADLVIVAGSMDGLIPSIDPKLPLDEQEIMMEEQRRLFYVAITRTRQTLVLSSVRFLPMKLAHRMRARFQPVRNSDLGFTIPSRFLSQLGPACPQAVEGDEFLKSL